MIQLDPEGVAVEGRCGTWPRSAIAAMHISLDLSSCRSNKPNLNSGPHMMSHEVLSHGRSEIRTRRLSETPSTVALHICGTWCQKIASLVSSIPGQSSPPWAGFHLIDKEYEREARRGRRYVVQASGARGYRDGNNSAASVRERENTVE